MQPYPTIQNYSYNPYLTNLQAQSNPYNPNPIPTMPSVPSVPASMSGRFVNDFSEVTASDIPMDGRSAVFVKNDKSEIQVREWSPNGQIVLTSYLPHIDQKDTNVDKLSTEVQKWNFDAKTEVLDPLFERIEELESKIDKLSKPQRVKKEVSDE